jgi:hypothetical protein
MPSAANNPPPNTTFTADTNLPTPAGNPPRDPASNPTRTHNPRTKTNKPSKAQTKNPQKNQRKLTLPLSTPLPYEAKNIPL